MKVTVKIYGTLRKYITDYDHQNGILLELPENTSVEELIDYLGIPKKIVGIVSANGALVKPGDALPKKGIVKVLQRISGG